MTAPREAPRRRSRYFEARSALRESLADVFARVLAIREELEHGELGLALSEADRLWLAADDVRAALEWAAQELALDVGEVGSGR